ncbi:deoxyxylulose-5-phosphate synthase [Acidimicrobium ferrooxidans DSM 10331]|uniref:1-deoxy-D-xylulose-5-phosphate synthase n=1 Tax=Acidimicrobium ferrooxidans (strain DSM 10331 / JCM 15462 / NBRC 103882 / ICP) TaxID=525909 RepID=C7M352_ACIFD|nr:1-deoxy-D-xylulose-5-phosphate synthase [Acidimicrobium ferrooxidans]ACU53446.1 deoxyxylulose-5-phosphate synthase [Acidimicrobium ferrooxidans DSM 10331]
MSYELLDRIKGPEDLRSLTPAQRTALCAELRERIVTTVLANGGHLGSNLGAVELTIALHLAFDSPRDAILFDTGHQTYPHKLLTGRHAIFDTLRQQGGLSGYPNRAESEHDWIENSHASTALSYAYGIAAGFDLTGSAPHRRVVAVVGDGSLTGGLAYEALNTIGHRKLPIIIVWNDNGRSYAPTISRLSSSLTRLRLNPTYMSARNRVKQVISDIPRVGPRAASQIASVTAALREAIEPRVFFEALGIRYAGPVDGHDIDELVYAFEGAKEWDGPIAVHVLTEKGRGYQPAVDDEVQRMHDLKVPRALTTIEGAEPVSFTEAFSRALVDAGERDRRVVAITAAMGAPTGLLPFQERFGDRYFDVGIAEAHAVTAAAGMAMVGLRPVVAIYSTFLSRAFDQANLDVGLHHLPVVFVADRAGITGDDGPSHHGVLDLVEMLAIPDVTIFTPSSADEVRIALEEALKLDGPSLIRFSKTPGPRRIRGGVGTGLGARVVRDAGSGLVIVAYGKMVTPALTAADLLHDDGLEATVIDPRVVRPIDPDLIALASSADAVVTVEDGYVHGGAGAFLADALRAVRPTIPVATLGIPTRYIHHGPPDALLADLGLDGFGIAAKIRTWLGAHESATPEITSDPA